MNISDIKARVDALYTVSSNNPDIERLSTLYHSTITVMHALYGPGSAHEKTLQGDVEKFGSLRTAGVAGGTNSPFAVKYAIEAIRGALSAIKDELDSGFLGSLRVTLTGEVLTDFVKLARTTLEQSGDGAKNVAAVLTAAAFEDVIRRLAELKGLPHQEKLADVITELKNVGVLQGAEVGTAQSYLTFRNRALHAQWNEVSRPVVESALAFTEQMLLKHLS